MIRIDMREPALWAAVSATVPAESGYALSLEPLEVGDAIVETPAGARLVFERKTIADLGASIRDGRYREQKLRMQTVAPPAHITYLIESGGPAARGPPPSALLGAFVHTMYRDGMHVLWTDGPAESAEWIWNAAHKSRELAPPTAIGGGGYLAAVRAKTKKQDNIDPATCYLLQLCQIPGISQKIAQGIADAYPNMPALLDALAPLDAKARAKALAGIPLLGPKRAATIVRYLFPGTGGAAAPT